MSPTPIMERVLRKDWTVASEPGALGPEAAPDLLATLEVSDPQVRELGLACLNVAGGPSARRGFLRSLRDANEGVRGAAAQYLRAHFTPEDIPAVKHELTESHDPYVRENLALLLGAAGDKDLVSFLKERDAAEKDQRARRAFTLALARLGDEGGRKRLVGWLARTDPLAERVAAIRDLPYVNDPALLPHLGPALDDMRPAQNVGTSHRPRYIRVCDVAVNVADAMLGKRLAWVDGCREYTGDELNLARLVLIGGAKK